MPANALIQTRIDPAVKERAAEVLSAMGMTVSDAVRMLLTRTANEGVLPLLPAKQSEEYDAWFRAKVQEALDDPRPPLPNEEIRANFATIRAEMIQKAKR
jgi:DNA-damage-inducible protein J